MASLPENLVNGPRSLIQAEFASVCGQVRNQFNQLLWLIVAVYRDVCWDRWNTVVEMFEGSYGDAMALWHLYVQHHRPYTKERDYPAKVLRHWLDTGTDPPDTPTVVQELDSLYDSGGEENYDLKLVYCPQGLATMAAPVGRGDLFDWLWLLRRGEKDGRIFQPPCRQIADE